MRLHLKQAYKHGGYCIHYRTPTATSMASADPEMVYLVSTASSREKLKAEAERASSDELTAEDLAERTNRLRCICRTLAVHITQIDGISFADADTHCSWQALSPADRNSAIELLQAVAPELFEGFIDHFYGGATVSEADLEG